MTDESASRRPRPREPHPLVSPERGAAADALRLLIETFVSHDPEATTLAELAAWAEQTTATIAASPPHPHALTRVEELVVGGWGQGGGRAVDALCDRAVVGSANPASYDIWIDRDGDEVVAEAWLGNIAGGAPGRAHGGVVAAIFDDVTGHVPPIHGMPAFTGELSVRYSRPVPLERLISFRAWLAGRSESGRRLFVESSASVEGVEVATSRATFVTVDSSRFRPGTPESAGAI